MIKFLRNCRLNLTLAALICCIATVFAQTAPTTHIVDRGETLQSIADRYGITTAQLIEANPDAKEFVYVGMELQIPATATVATRPSTTSSTSTPAPLPAGGAADSYADYSSVSPEGPGFAPIFDLEWGFLPKAKEVKNHNFAYAITFGANYYFMEKENKLFAGASIGYNSFNYSYFGSYQGDYLTQTNNVHCIAIPIRVGYSIKTDNRKFGITPLIGLDFNCGVKTTEKFKSRGNQLGNREEKVNGKKGLGLGFRAGLEFSIAGFNIGGAYVLPINNKQEYFSGDDGYFAVSIGWGL